MKKKLALLLSVVLAIVSVLGIFALTGCGRVRVDISKKEVEVTVGKATTLTATASNGGEIIWSSDNESVATVASNGRVTGVKAGTATITASSGNGSATCKVTVKDPVTFTFKNASGNAITELTVDRNADPVQISAVASDGGAITSWSVEDEKIATVSKQGVVTGVKEGVTDIIVRSANGSGKISVTVIDTAEHESITDGAAAPGKWWYYASTNDNRSPEIITNEVRKGVVTFEFGGNVNWNKGDVQLGMKRNADVSGYAWAKLTGTITSDVEGTLAIFDTDVSITKGANPFTVYYQQEVTDEMVYIQPYNDIAGAKFEIRLSDLHWEEYTLRSLAAPTFALDGDTVTVTDTNAEGVKEYNIGFFDGETLISSQSSKTATYEIDSLGLNNGTYTVKVKASGVSGFIDSDWSAVTAEYVVNNKSIVYDIERTTTPSPSRWTYYSVYEDSCGDATEAKYVDGVVTFKTDYLGWKFDSTQMYRHYAQFASGATLKLDMRVKSNQAGRLFISGNVVTLAEGDNNIELFIEQPKSGSTITILFGAPSAGSDTGMDWNGASEFEFEVKEIRDFTPRALAVPSATYDSENKEITLDEYADADAVSKYEVGFFDDTDKLMGAATVAEDKTFSDLAIKDGTYTLKVRAVPKTIEFKTSDWSDAIATDYVVANGGVQYDLKFGGDYDGGTENGNAVTNPGNWYYWNDQNWTGSSVTANSAVYSRGTISVSYTVNGGACDYGLQIYYKNPDLTVKNSYKLTLNIKSDEAVAVVINEADYSLVKGDNAITVYYTEAVGIGYSFSMQVKVNAEAVAHNTLVLSDVVWTT